MFCGGFVIGFGAAKGVEIINSDGLHDSSTPCLDSVIHTVKWNYTITCDTDQDLMIGQPGLAEGDVLCRCKPEEGKSR